METHQIEGGVMARKKKGSKEPRGKAKRLDAGVLPSGKKESKLTGMEKAIAVGTQALHRWRKEHREGPEGATKLPTRRLSILNASLDRLQIDSYPKARLVIAAVIRALGRQELPAQTGSAIIQGIKAAVATLEAEQRLPTSDQLAERFRVSLDLSRTETGPILEGDVGTEEGDTSQGPAKVE
jgi:hypothetical protein